MTAITTMRSDGKVEACGWSMTADWNDDELSGVDAVVLDIASLRSRRLSSCEQTQIRLCESPAVIKHKIVHKNKVNTNAQTSLIEHFYLR